MKIELILFRKLLLILLRQSLYFSLKHFLLTSKTKLLSLNQTISYKTNHLCLSRRLRLYRVVQQKIYEWYFCSSWDLKHVRILVLNRKYFVYILIRFDGLKLIFLILYMIAFTLPLDPSFRFRFSGFIKPVGCKRGENVSKIPSKPNVFLIKLDSFPGVSCIDS